VSYQTLILALEKKSLRDKLISKGLSFLCKETFGVLCIKMMWHTNYALAALG
jgi:hypothetical protein